MGAPRLTTLALALVAVLGCGRPPVPAASPVPAATSVWKDPLTGRLGGPPPGAAPASAPAARLSSSAAGLVEEAAPRGGWMVRLQGRFQNQLRATRSGAKPSVRCDQDQR